MVCRCNTAKAGGKEKYGKWGKGDRASKMDVKPTYKSGLQLHFSLYIIYNMKFHMSTKYMNCFVQCSVPASVPRAIKLSQVYFSCSINLFVFNVT